MRSANIKNLSIALEALSRFPSNGNHSPSIKRLLEKEIQLMQEEQHPLKTQTQPDDEIPF